MNKTKKQGPRKGAHAVPSIQPICVECVAIRWSEKRIRVQNISSSLPLPYLKVAQALSAKFFDDLSRELGLVEKWTDWDIEFKIVGIDGSVKQKEVLSHIREVIGGAATVTPMSTEVFLSAKLRDTNAGIIVAGRLRNSANSDTLPSVTSNNTPRKYDPPKKERVESHEEIRDLVQPKLAHELTFRDVALTLASVEQLAKEVSVDRDARREWVVSKLMAFPAFAFTPETASLIVDHLNKIARDLGSEWKVDVSPVQGFLRFRGDRATIELNVVDTHISLRGHWNQIQLVPAPERAKYGSKTSE